MFQNIIYHVFVITQNAENFYEGVCDIYFGKVEVQVENFYDHVNCTTSETWSKYFGKLIRDLQMLSSCNEWFRMQRSAKNLTWYI